MTLAQLLSTICTSPYAYEPHQVQTILQYYLNSFSDMHYIKKATICNLAEIFHAPDRINAATSARIHRR